MYIAIGQTAENVREVENVSRQEMDEFGLSQQRAVANVENGFWADEITPVTLPDEPWSLLMTVLAPDHLKVFPV